jgi:hypothetical protein
VSALVGYGKNQGWLDIRLYGTQEMAQQECIHNGEAEIAR